MIHAMLFDLDGTLVRTEELKALSYARAAVELKPELRKADVIEAFPEVIGRSRDEVARYLLGKFDLAEGAAPRMAEFAVETPWEAFIQVRLRHYEAMLADDATIRDNQWPYSVALLRQARTNCRAVGLATMSYYSQVRRVLSVLGLEDAFDFVATREDVENGKPGCCRRPDWWRTREISRRRSTTC